MLLEIKFNSAIDSNEPQSGHSFFSPLEEKRILQLLQIFIFNALTLWSFTAVYRQYEFVG